MPARRSRSNRRQRQRGGAGLAIGANTWSAAEVTAYLKNESNGEGEGLSADLIAADTERRTAANTEGKILLDNWFAARKSAINKILNNFDESGKPVEGELFPTGNVNATAFSDLYKWTMMPVMRIMENYKGGKDSCTVTFGIDLRDGKGTTENLDGLRIKLKKETAARHPLRTEIEAALDNLTKRKFDREMFKSILKEHRADIFKINGDADAEKALLDDICGPDGSERMLAQRVEPFFEVANTEALKTKLDSLNINNKEVTILFYKNNDAKYNVEDADSEKGLYFIEATGPWHKVTWLETSMMQAVYQAKITVDLKERGESYAHWLYGALLRCANSVSYTRTLQLQKPGTTLSALFTGRRTGGMAFLILQNLFFADHFTQNYPPKLGGPKPVENSMVVELADGKTVTPCLGTSSCDSLYLLNKLGLPCLNPAGTHAHELSMVSSVLYPQLDANPLQIPITQVIGHYLYFEHVFTKTGGLMAMLSDTLGTRSFLRAAKYIKAGEDNKALLGRIMVARQDSGKLHDFKLNMAAAEYKGTTMASEIDFTHTLLEAAEEKYDYFGAGGFFGDSEKVWAKTPNLNNSMAVKAVRVSYTTTDNFKYAGIPYMLPNTVDGAGVTVTGYPVKIGDPKKGEIPELTKDDKLSIDKNMPVDFVKDIKKWASSVRVRAGKTSEALVVEGEGERITDIFDFATGQVKKIAGAAGGRRRSSRRNKRNNRRSSTRRHRNRSNRY
jgi:nicotinic acid phosphoribosyltransferase